MARSESPSRLGFSLLSSSRLFKEEMYNTMNSYDKYTSIPKSSFNKINIHILPVNTGEKYLIYSIHFAYICG